MPFEPHSSPIPEARLRPTGAGARARAAGGDAQQWIAARALGAGRFAGRVLPPILAITMIMGVIIALGISVGHRDRTHSYDFEFDYEQFRVQQALYEQQLDTYLRNQELLRQMDMYRAPAPYLYDHSTPSLYAPEEPISADDGATAPQ